MERVVKRSELQSDDESSPSSPEQNVELAREEFEYVQRTTNDGLPGAIDDAAQEDELDFVLFAPSAQDATKQGNSQPVSKIKLQSPEPQSSDPGFVVPSRNPAYYFSGELTVNAKAAIESSAITGAAILAQSKSPWPGTAYDWRVVRFPATRKQRAKLSQSNAVYDKLLGQLTSSGHKRKGKVARLKIRKQIAAKKTQQENSKKAAEEKEALEREKRTRRNREKKVKKKLRDKAKKQGADAEEEEEASTAD